MIKKVEFLKHPPIVGKRYFVKCVKFKGVWCPIIGKKHTDKKLNIDYQHYHIDARFSRDKVNSFFPEHNGIFKVLNTEDFKLSKPEYKRLTCLRTIDDLISKIYSYDTVFEKFRIQFKKTKLKIINHRCPHKGYNLKNTPVKNGVIICPMHCLRFDAKTGKQI